MLISEKLIDLEIIDDDFADIIQKQTGEVWVIIDSSNNITEMSCAAQAMLQPDINSSILSFFELLCLDASARIVIGMLLNEARETQEAFSTPSITFKIGRNKVPCQLSIIPQGTNDEDKIIIGLKESKVEIGKDELGIVGPRPDADKKLKFTLNSIGEGVITTDPEGYIQLINPEAEDITGWKSGEATGKHLSAVFLLKSQDDNEKSTLPSPIDDVISSGEAVGSDHICLIDANGKERIIAYDLAPVNSDGILLGTVLVFNDLTEKLTNDKQLQKIQKMESLAVLSSGIAHDFNNFLTSIMGNLSLGKRFLKEDDKLMGILNAAERGTKRAKYLTDRLFTFSKGTAPIKSDVSIKNLIQDSTSLILSGCNCRCNTTLPNDLWVTEVDEGQISQVLNNLLINAHQAMPEGGCIQIDAENLNMTWDRSLKMKNGPFVKILIKDEGVGIAPENLGKLFEPYFTTKPTGNGLGLATTYSIIKAHYGHIEVESQIDKGTSFIIYLPAKPGVQLVNESEIAQQIFHGSGRILLMDDEDIIQQIAGDMITHLGYTIDFSIDGTEAINKYKQAMERGVPYDAVILDLSVTAGMGGLDCLNELKKIDPEVSAILSSGYAHNPEVVKHKEYGFKATVIKPYNIEQMSWTLKTIVNKER